MSPNKATVTEYMAAFNQLDHARILATLTDDVVWILPGVYRHVGKEAFDREIENPGFKGLPQITTTRLLEENDVVVAEGSVRVQKSSGEYIDLVFCDLFVMRDTKIQQLTSYLMEVK